LLSFAIVTTGAMPVILEATSFQQWMLCMLNKVAALMKPHAGEIDT
jgi:hypothetical protein